MCLCVRGGGGRQQQQQQRAWRHNIRQPGRGRRESAGCVAVVVVAAAATLTPKGQQRAAPKLGCHGIKPQPEPPSGPDHPGAGVPRGRTVRKTAWRPREDAGRRDCSTLHGGGARPALTLLIWARAVRASAQLVLVHKSSCGRTPDAHTPPSPALSSPPTAMAMSHNTIHWRAASGAAGPPPDTVGQHVRAQGAAAPIPAT